MKPTDIVAANLAIQEVHQSNKELYLYDYNQCAYGRIIHVDTSVNDKLTLSLMDVNGDFTCIPTTFGIGKMKQHPHQRNDFTGVMELELKFQHNIEKIYRRKIFQLYTQEIILCLVLAPPSLPSLRGRK